jgi:hypothetical protein
MTRALGRRSLFPGTCDTRDRSLITAQRRDGRSWIARDVPRCGAILDEAPAAQALFWALDLRNRSLHSPSPEVSP